MTRPTARVLTLLEILQGGGTTSVGALAERLGVDERTVRRYAVHLADLGIPVEARRGRYGGYRLAPGFKLPPLMLTDDEAVAVLLGLVAGRRSGLVTAEQAAADSATAKIRRVLPATLGRRIDALLAGLAMTAPVRNAAPPETGVLLVLAEAARHGRPVQMRYTSWRGTADGRRFDPYGLVFHSGRWYTTGFDHARAAVRTFRLDRVDSVEPRDGSFQVPAGFDPAAQVLAGLAAVPYAHEISVVLRTDLVSARRRVPAAFGTLSEVPDGVRMRARAEHLTDAARLLAGLGFALRVEQPEALRDELRALAARLAEA